jgi:hypothetical protein
MDMRFTLVFEGKDPTNLPKLVAHIHNRLYAARQKAECWTTALRPTDDATTCNPQVTARVPTPTTPDAALSPEHPVFITLSGTLGYPPCGDHDSRFDHQEQLLALAEALAAELNLTLRVTAFDTKVVDASITLV